MRNHSRLLLVSSISSSLICKAFQGSIPSPIQSTQCCHASNMGLRRLFWVWFDIIPVSALKRHQFPRGSHDTSPWNKSYVRLRQHDSKEENTAKNFGGGRFHRGAGGLKTSMGPTEPCPWWGRCAGNIVAVRWTHYQLQTPGTALISPYKSF